MNPLGQIMAYVLVAGFLALAIFLACRKQYIFSAVVTGLSAATFAWVELTSGGVFTFQNNLTTEQLFCWAFGIAIFVMSCFFVKKNHLSYAFVIFLISVMTCFCGLSAVQGLLKTHLLWQVTNSLKDYSQKIDKYQTTVGEMERHLTEEQSTLSTNQLLLVSNLLAIQTRIGTQQRELSEVQAKIQEAESNVFNQQSDITNQFQRISKVQSNLTMAQTNILAQQEKLTNVESLVNTLFSNTEDEQFGLGDTNKIVVLKLAGVDQLVFRLRFAPVPNSVQAIQINDMGQWPILPQMGQFKNVLSTRFRKDSDLNKTLFHFRYIKDSRETSLIQNMIIVNTNAVSLDGSIVPFN